METESIFRLAFAVILLSALGLSGYFRRRARRVETIARREEGLPMMVARLAFALLFFPAIMAYVVNPRLMDWSVVSLPAAARWLGVIVGLSMLPVLHWVFRSIGRNISETVLTKSGHELVTHGPYRWVRHPLYAAATITFLGLGLIAANGFILGMGVLIFAAIGLIVVPREEANLIARFGQRYLDYIARTPRLFPLGPRSPGRM